MTEALVDLIRSNEWMVRVLATVRDEHIPAAWVGAGVLRDLVWGERYGSGFSPEQVRDVDVAFFDPHDLSRANDDWVTERLRQRSRPGGGTHLVLQQVRRRPGRTVDIDSRCVGNLARSWLSRHECGWVEG